MRIVWLFVVSAVGSAVAAAQAPVPARSSASAPVAFVSNETGGTITAIDTRTNAVVATYQVGARPRGIAVSPDGSQVLVALSDLQRRTEGPADGIAVISLANG